MLDLYCLTNDTQCCEEEATSHGTWTSPANSTEVSQSRRDVVHFVRGPSYLLLKMLENATTGLLGVYTCIIPDSEGVFWPVNIGIYQNISQGEVLIEEYIAHFLLLSDYRLQIVRLFFQLLSFRGAGCTSWEKHLR